MTLYTVKMTGCIFFSYKCRKNDRETWHFGYCFTFTNIVFDVTLHSFSILIYDADGIDIHLPDE